MHHYPKSAELYIWRAIYPNQSLAVELVASSGLGGRVMADEQSPGADAGVDEYEREPVPARAQMGFKSFVGMYAGEQKAGTELMIGPLFVARGVSAYDLIVGLLLGNLLAVLSWTFLTAPIATNA